MELQVWKLDHYTNIADDQYKTIESPVPQNNSFLLPRSGWQFYLSGQGFYTAENFSIITGEVEYPDILAVSVNETDQAKLYAGIYQKIAGVIQNRRPVWKNLNNDLLYLYFNGARYWMMGPDYQSNTGDIKSRNPGQFLLPSRLWDFAFIKSLTSSGAWIPANIYIQEAEPSLPKTVDIRSLKTEQFQNLTGIYEMQKQSVVEGVPVWENKETGNTFDLYFHRLVFASPS